MGERVKDEQIGQPKAENKTSETKKNRDLKAEIGRKRKENYYKIKAKVLEREKTNRESLYVVDVDRRGEIAYT